MVIEVTLQRKTEPLSVFYIFFYYHIIVKICHGCARGLHNKAGNIPFTFEFCNRELYLAHCFKSIIWLFEMKKTVASSLPVSRRFTVSEMYSQVHTLKYTLLLGMVKQCFFKMACFCDAGHQANREKRRTTHVDRPPKGKESGPQGFLGKQLSTHLI